MNENDKIYRKTEQKFKKLREKVKTIVIYNGWWISCAKWIELAETLLEKKDPDLLAYKEAMKKERETRQ